MKKEHRQKAVPWVLLIAMIAAVLLSVNCGYSRIPYSDVIASLLNPGDPNASVILLQIRLPRIVLAVLCGMGLALSGCVLQAVTENPLADPGILGINAGAGFTVMLFLTLFPALHTSTMIYQPLFAMAGGLLAAVLLYVFSKRNGKVRPAYLLLGGIGFIGLVAPHIARKFVGGRHPLLLPASMLFGGLLLLLADTIGRSLFGPIEIPVGIVISVLAAPYFLILLRRQI